MFSNAVRLFVLDGFEIKLDPSWFLIAGLITWTLATQYFPTTMPDQTGAAYLLLAIIAMLGFFSSLLLHELAHSVVARRFGVRINAITLFLFGGVAEFVKRGLTIFGGIADCVKVDHFHLRSLFANFIYKCTNTVDGLGGL